MTSKIWRRQKLIAVLESPWIRLIAEHWIDDRERDVDYWRAERVDSVIVLPIHREMLLLAPATFRPGVDRQTLDFPGGRLSGGVPADAAVVPLLLRELGIPAEFVAKPEPINTLPWEVDSSFSSQKLWGFSAHIDSRWDPDRGIPGMSRVPLVDGLPGLLHELSCLQCRGLLLEWLRQQPAR